MSFLYQSGLAALGLVVVAVVAPAQQTVIQAPMTQVEAPPPDEPRVRMPFFHFFHSSYQKPAPQVPMTVSETAEPPLAGPLDPRPQLTTPPTSAGTQIAPTPYRPGPGLGGSNGGYSSLPLPYSGYQPTTVSNIKPASAPQPYPTYQPAPARQPALIPPPQAPAQAPAPSHAAFASTFQPVPGQYQVQMLHPFSGQVVTVSFQLPPGRGAYQTRVTARYVEFDSPDHTVDIRFARDGQVFVDQD